MLVYRCWPLLGALPLSGRSVCWQQSGTLALLVWLKLPAAAAVTATPSVLASLQPCRQHLIQATASLPARQGGRPAVGALWGRLPNSGCTTCIGASWARSGVVCLHHHWYPHIQRHSTQIAGLHPHLDSRQAAESSSSEAPSETRSLIPNN